ncbi:HAD-IB family phosphatase, partial [Neisseria meningitidis]
LSPGAEFLLDECKRHDVKFLLVSGGFTFFTERLQQRLGFEYQHANVLEIENGRLTGRLKGRIIDAQAKADLLREYRSRLGLQPHQVLAMGDGANDIPMLKEAGIGVAYRAKPKVQAAADACINFGGLERVRGLFG